MKLPGINIFLMMPDMAKSDKLNKKKSSLSDALKSDKEDYRHQEMILKLSDMIREVKSLPHIAHSGGG